MRTEHTWIIAITDCFSMNLFRPSNLPGLHISGSFYLFWQKCSKEKLTVFPETVCSREWEVKSYSGRMEYACCKGTIVSSFYSVLVMHMVCESLISSRLVWNRLQNDSRSKFSNPNHFVWEILLQIKWDLCKAWTSAGGGEDNKCWTAEESFGSERAKADAMNKVVGGLAYTAYSYYILTHEALVCRQLYLWHCFIRYLWCTFLKYLIHEISKINNKKIDKYVKYFFLKDQICKKYNFPF